MVRDQAVLLFIPLGETQRRVRWHARRGGRVDRAGVGAGGDAGQSRAGGTLNPEVMKTLSFGSGRSPGVLSRG